MMYSPNRTVDAIAIEATNKMRSILHEGVGGGELHTYVNYAFGNETLENMYGYEKWRVERLRALKREYDPFGRFNYYAPIS
jgi:FAD/FMN-containing dehydrogenase